MTIRSLVVGGGGRSLTAASIARVLLSRGMTDAEVRSAIGTAASLQSGLVSVLDRPTPSPAPAPSPTPTPAATLGPVTFVSTNNTAPISGATIATNDARTTFFSRIAQPIDVNLAEFQLRPFNWKVTFSGGDGVATLAWRVVAAAIEYRGVSVPVTFGGGRTTNVAVTAVGTVFSVEADPIPMTAFGNGPVTGPPYLRVLFEPVGGSDIWLSAYTFDAGGSVTYQFDPNVTVPAVDAVGPIAKPSGALGTFRAGPAIHVMGRFPQTYRAKRIIAIGDSISAYQSDGEGVLAGAGFIQRAAYGDGSAPIPVINLAYPGEDVRGFVAKATTRRALFKYVSGSGSCGVFGYGTNSLAANPANLDQIKADTLATFQAMRAEGIEKIVATHIIPRTTSPTKSITAMTVDGTTATALIEDGEPFPVGLVVTVAGASISAFNGSKTVTAATRTSFSYTVAAGLAAPTGTMTWQDTYRTERGQVPITPNFPGQRAEYLAWLQQQLAAGMIDRISRVDLAVNGLTNPEVFRANSLTQGTATDGIHPREKGHAAMAVILRADIDSLYA